MVDLEKTLGRQGHIDDQYFAYHQQIVTDFSLIVYERTLLSLVIDAYMSPWHAAPPYNHFLVHLPTKTRELLHLSIYS